jgi:hypothetical protein
MSLAKQLSAESLWTNPRIGHLGCAILCTVAYADVFDYPLTLAEIHRYLVGMATSLDSVSRVLKPNGWVGRRLGHRANYYTLPGSEHLVELRRWRAEVASRMWPEARRYAEAISRLPFVRLVAVTGALTMDNVDPGDDFDFLIVTEAGRLWLTRAMVIGMIVKPASRQGDEVCPNYLLTEHALEFPEHNLYVAHELSQMIPLAGLNLYQRIRDRNLWTRRFLPNATGPPRPVNPAAQDELRGRYFLERTLRSRLGGEAGALGKPTEDPAVRAPVRRPGLSPVRHGSVQRAFRQQGATSH